MTASRATGSDDTTAPRPDHGRTIERGTLVGRYTVIEEIGAGGMGVVYLAYDPELDRRVALKFLLAIEPGDDDLGGARLLREAKAIAQVSHPNVVAVYDVDTYAGDVYVAMEYVEGVSISEWIRARDRGRTEILDAFVQAGEGLSAAHDRGVVHRDFKPHNVLCGNDGRVRVLDFGLAYTGNEPPPDEGVAPSPTPTDPMDRLTETGVVMGTPAYMSPEQNEGRPTDARSDQFSFCMSLCEGLTGLRPRVLEGVPGLPAAARKDLPGWLADVIERGLAETPDERFPSMRALLGAIRQRRRRRARRLTAAAAIAGAAAVAAALWALQPAGVVPCEGAGARAESVWNPSVRQRIERAFDATGVSYARDSFAKVATALDRYQQGFRQHSRDTCEATHVRHEQSAPRMDLRMDCLNRRLRELEALVQTLDRADAETVAGAVPATQALRPLDDCRDVAALESGAPLPDDAETRAEVLRIHDELAAARAARTTGDLRATRTLLAPLVARAEATGHARTEAEVGVELGLTLAALDEDDSASGRFESAYFDATAAGDMRLALYAATELAVLAATDGAYADAERWTKHVRALAAGARDRSDQALALEALGRVERHRGQLDEAAELLTRAIALRRQDDRPVPLAGALVELARIGAANDDPGRHVHLAEAERLLVSTYGDTHPATLQVWIDQANKASIKRALAIHEAARVLSPRQEFAALHQLARLELEDDDFLAALPLLVEAAALARARLGEHSAELGQAYRSIAYSYARRAQYDTAIEYGRLGVAQMRAALGPDHPQVARSLNNLGLDLSYFQRKDQALAIFEEAMAILDRYSGTRYDLRGNLLNNMAMVYSARGDHDKAVELYQKSADVRALGLGENHVKVGDSYTNLGSVMSDQGRLDEAAAYQRKALAIYEKANARFREKTGHEHRDLAWPLTDLGMIAIDQKRPAEAVPLLERALAIRLAAGVGPRFLGKTQFLLAEALWDSGIDRKRALELADEARSTFSRGNTANEERWLADLAAWRKRIGH